MLLSKYKFLFRHLKAFELSNSKNSKSNFININNIKMTKFLRAFFSPTLYRRTRSGENINKGLNNFQRPGGMILLG